MIVILAPEEYYREGRRGMMAAEQEARLLENQALIMQALKVLLASAGQGGMGNQLEVRIKDIEAFLAKADQP